jgi:hypothetical protein
VLEEQGPVETGARIFASLRWAQTEDKRWTGMGGGAGHPAIIPPPGGRG